MSGDLISRKALVKNLLQVRQEYKDKDINNNNRFCATMRGGLRKALREVEKAPAVDAVEIVRCKDCVYRGNASKCPMCFSEYFDSFETDYGMDCTVTDNTTDDGFCHKGAKMDKEEE